MRPLSRYRCLGLLLACLGSLGAQGAPAPTPVQTDAERRQPLVSRIEISGLEQIDETVVRSAMQLKLGQPFDPARLQRDVDAIYDLGWFYFDRENSARGSVITRREDADGNVELHLIMVENPVVGELRLLGAEQQPTAEQLAERVAWLKVGRPLNTNPDRIARALREIEAIYREKLQREVVATVPRAGESPAWFERQADGRVRVNIRISDKGTAAAPAPVQTPPTPPVTAPTDPAPAPTDPAPAPTPGAPAPRRDEPLIGEERLKVSAIEVKGLQNLRQELVLDTIETKAGQSWDRERLQQDINRLYELGWFYFSLDREALGNLGYPVPGPEIGSKGYPEPDAEQRGVNIIFAMVENPQIKQVKFIGNTVLTQGDLLEDLAFLKPGFVLNTNPEKLQRDLERVESKYRSRGYLASAAYGSPADNIPLLTPEPDGTVTVTLRVDELRVGDINFEWTNKKRTSERVLRAYMRVKPGELFNYNRITEDLNEIRRLDILEDITLREPQVSPEDPTRLNLTFELTEKRTGNISAGGGISSRFGLVGFVDVSQNNLFGLAQRVATRVEFGGRFNFSTSYFYPLLDGAGSEVSLRLYNTEDRTGATGIGAFTNQRANFDQVRRGASILFSRPLIPTLRASVGYEFENVATQRRGSQLPNLPPFPFQDLGSDTTSSMTFGLIHDTRDFPFDASKGMYQSGSIEVAGLGGDNRFGKYRLETRHYWPVLGGQVTSGRRMRPSWVVATRAMYGFSSGKPPFSQSFFVGGSETLRGYEEDRFFGDRMFLLNLELRKQFKNNIQAVAFFDAGRAWFRGEKMDFLDDLASAVGLGVRVSTPVGPLRFDIGFGADGNRTHFSFGQPF